MLDGIAFDGDDTLWHNETLFQETQARLREILSHYAPLEEIDRRLYETEIRNLRLFGYGVKGFTLSMVEAAIELSQNRVDAADIHRIVQMGKAMLDAPVELLDGARAALEGLADRHRLVLITKGDLIDQGNKLDRSGLSDLFQAVEIVPEKDVACYRRVAARQGMQIDRLLMVGNSMRSDVLPVVEAGGYAVHVPYHVTWAHEVVEAELPAGRAWRLESLTGLPDVLAEIEATRTR